MTSHHINTLARLLAEENLTVSFDKGNEVGAAIDLEKRVVHISTDKLSVLNDDELEGMTLHEIGHALFTPTAEWIAFIKKYPRLKHTLNVVEDAREERLVKEKYPGARRAFRRFYDSLILKRDAWKLVDPRTGMLRDFSRDSIINRLNIHFKMIENEVRIPFAPGIEQDFVNEIARCTTFEQACDITLRLGAYAEQEKKNKKDRDEDNKSGKGKGEDGKGQAGEPGEPGDGDASAEPGELSENPVDDLVKEKINEGHNPNSDKVVTSDKAFSSVYEGNFYDTLKAINKDGTALDRNWFDNNNTLVVGMAQRFNMKQSARKQERTRTAKTGLIDPDKLVNYRTAANIMLKRQQSENGKNHGFVVFIDFSGSMTGVISSVMEQVVIQIKFFERVNVPYLVYGFTDGSNGNPKLFRVVSSDDKKPQRESVINFLSTLKYRTAFDIDAKFEKIVPMMGTPLIACLGAFALKGREPTLQRFLTRNRVEKLNLCLFTDGGATDRLPGTIMVDSQHRMYAPTDEEKGKPLSCILGIIQRKYKGMCDFKVMNFFLSSHEDSAKRVLDIMFAGMKKTGKHEYSAVGIDRVYIMKPTDRNAYREILNSYIDLIA